MALLGDPAFNSDCRDGVPTGVAEIAQTFLVPFCMNNPTLILDYRLRSQDSSATGFEHLFDGFGIYLYDGNSEILVDWQANKERSASCSGDPWDSEWNTVTKPLSELGDFQGRPVTVIFRMHSRPEGKGHDWYNTYVYVDNVRLIDQ